MRCFHSVLHRSPCTQCIISGVQEKSTRVRSSSVIIIEQWRVHEVVYSCHFLCLAGRVGLERGSETLGLVKCLHRQVLLHAFIILHIYHNNNGSNSNNQKEVSTHQQYKSRERNTCKMTVRNTLFLIVINIVMTIIIIIIITIRHKYLPVFQQSRIVLYRSEQ